MFAIRTTEEVIDLKFYVYLCYKYVKHEIVLEMIG